MDAQGKQVAPYPLRLPPELRQRLQQRADELDRSLHWVIVKALQDSIPPKTAH